MQDPVNLLGKLNVTQCNMKQMVKHTAEPTSTMESTDMIVNILNSTHTKAELEEVTMNIFQLDDNQRENLLGLIMEFEDLFDGTLGKWDSLLVNLQVKTV